MKSVLSGILVMALISIAAWAIIGTQSESSATANTSHDGSVRITN